MLYNSRIVGNVRFFEAFVFKLNTQYAIRVQNQNQKKKKNKNISELEKSEKERERADYTII